MNKKILIGLVILLFFASQGQAARLYTWGKAETISLDTDTNTLHSFDGFDYKFKPDGSFRIFKDGIKQASYGFGMSGTFNGNSVYALSNDYDWIWTVVENNVKRIEVEGKRTNYDSVTFPWKINLVATRYGYLKMTNYVGNKHTTKDVTDLNFFYLFDVNQEANPTVAYYDDNDELQQYSYHTNQQRDTPDELEGINFNKITVPFFNFQFQDMLDDGYHLTYLYFGDLDEISGQLPDSNGYIVGFSKNNGLLAAGTGMEVDPIIRISDTLDGTIQYRNGIFLAVQTNAGFGMGYTSTPTSYSWYRGVWDFDLGVLRKVKKATFHTWYSGHDNTLSPLPHNVFDLNSIITLSGSIDSADWDSEVFDIVQSGWIGKLSSGTAVTINRDQNADVTTVWNNAIDNSRNYLAFRLALNQDDSNSIFTATDSESYRISICDVSSTSGSCVADGSTDPFIEYELLTDLDINIASPIGGDFLSTTLYSDLNYPIDFNILNENGDNNYLFAKVYYSDTGDGDLDNAIILDLNLLQMALYPTKDFNCSWDAKGFATAQRCYIGFPFNGVADGNWFIDINAYHYDSNVYDNGFDNNWFITSSTTSFYIDNTDTTTSWDGNHNTWQAGDANITLTCDNLETGSPCYSISYHFDKDSSLFKDWDTIVTTSASTASANLPTASNADGNWAIRFKSVDVADNTPTDWNIFFVLIDRSVPTVGVQIPDANTTTGDSTPDFNINFSDVTTNSNSGVTTCDYNYYVDNVLIASGTDTAIEGNCQYTVATDLTNGQVAHIDWDAVDNAGNVSAHITGYSLTYIVPIIIIPGRGGGGGGIPLILSFLLREPTDGTIVKLMLAGTEEEFELVVKNDSEQNFLLEVVPDANISEYVSCENMKQIEVAQIEAIICTVDLTDFNAGTALQETLEGSISLKVPGKTIEVPVKILIVQPGGITWLILLIKEAPYGYAGAIVVILASLIIAAAGIIGVIKSKNLQVLATLGGGSVAVFLIFMLVII